MLRFKSIDRSKASTDSEDGISRSFDLMFRLSIGSVDTSCPSVIPEMFRSCGLQFCSDGSTILDGGKCEWCDGPGDI